MMSIPERQLGRKKEKRLVSSNKNWNALHEE